MLGFLWGVVELDRWASKPSLGRGRVRVGQMGSKKLPLGLKNMGRERGIKKTQKKTTTKKISKKQNQKHTLLFLQANIESNVRCGKPVKSLPTHHLSDETRARTALQKMLDEDSTAANTCLAFNIITTHRCAGGEFVQQKIASMFLISVFSNEHRLFFKTNMKPYLNYKRM